MRKNRIASELEKRRKQAEEELRKIELKQLELVKNNEQLSSMIKKEQDVLKELSEKRTLTEESITNSEKFIESLSSKADEIIEKMSSSKKIHETVFIERRLNGQKIYIHRNSYRVDIKDEMKNQIGMDESLAKEIHAITDRNIKAVGELIELNNKQYVYIYDIIEMDGKSLDNVPLSERKKIIYNFTLSDRVRDHKTIVASTKEEAKEIIGLLERANTTEKVSIRKYSATPEEEIIISLKTENPKKLEKQTKTLQAEKLSNERAKLREANKDNVSERCKFCSFFGDPTKCSIVKGPVTADLVCDWIQSRPQEETNAKTYKVSDEDFLDFVKGMIKKQPYSHKVIDGALTPEGLLVLIEDSAKPPHRFSLTRDFHVDHTSFEHHWTQKEVDDLIKTGKELSQDELHEMSATLSKFNLPKNNKELHEGVDFHDLPKDTVNYRQSVDIKKCGDCKFYQPYINSEDRSEGMCHFVRGVITDKFTCELWEGLESGDLNEPDEDKPMDIHSLWFMKTVHSRESAIALMEEKEIKPVSENNNNIYWRFVLRPIEEFKISSIAVHGIEEGIFALVGNTKEEVENQAKQRPSSVVQT